MSFSKVLCIAAAGSILFAGTAMARPDVSSQPPAAKAHHKHKIAKKAHRKHHRKHHKGNPQVQ